VGIEPLNDHNGEEISESVEISVHHPSGMTNKNADEDISRSPASIHRVFFSYSSHGETELFSCAEIITILA
jgi:hypothetical protein